MLHLHFPCAYTSIISSLSNHKETLLTFIVTLPLQIWDFHLGQLRAQEESGPLEVGYGSSDAGFMIKSYSELLKEESLATTKGFGEIYGINCSMTHEDTSAFMVSHLTIHI